MQITEKAAAKTQTILKSEDKKYLRVGIKGSGCQGFSYVVETTDSKKEKDQEIEINGLKIIFDQKSYIMLENVTMDFRTSLIQYGFYFINPQEEKTCGCGKSFSLKKD